MTTVAIGWTQSFPVDFSPGFRQYSLEDGLPSSEVYRVEQDADGNMWFATDAGVSVFDGYTFLTYTTENGLTDNSILYFYNDQSGRKWMIPLNNRLCYFEDGKVVEYKWNDRIIETIGNSIIYDFAVDSNGTVYCGFKGDGLLVVQPDGKVEHHWEDITIGCHTWQVEDDLVTFSVISQAARDLGQVTHYVRTPESETSFTFEALVGNISWKLARFGTGYIRGAGKGLVLVDQQMNVNTTILPNRVVQVAMTGDYVWTGLYKNGVVRFRGDSKGIDRDLWLLKGLSVSDIYRDREGGYWFTTLESGVFYTPDLEINHWGGYEASSIEIGKDGVYVGLGNGSVIRMNSAGDASYISDKPGIEVAAMYYDRHSETLWMDIDGLGYLRQEQSLKILNDTRYVTAARVITGDEEGNIWVGDHNSLCKITDREFVERFQINGVPIWVTALHAHEQGMLVGAPEGLYLLTDSVFSYLGDKDPVFRNRITDIAKFGKIYLLASRTNGMILWDGERTRTLTVKDGLPSNTVNALYIDGNDLWVGSGKGISRIRQNDNGLLEFDNVNTAHGLISNDIRDLVVFEENIWACSHEGVTKVNKKVFDHTATYVPVEIISFAVNSIDTTLEMRSLPHWGNSLTFKFLARNYALGNRIEYRYRLSGAEANWHSTYETNVSYSALSPGEYEFQVAAKNEDGEWTQELASFAFVINPPFWKTWWFRGSVIVVLVMMVYLFFRVRVLSYNRDVVRELLQAFVTKLKGPPKSEPEEEAPYFLVKSVANGATSKVYLGELMYLKASGNYVEVVTSGNVVLVRAQLKELEAQFAEAAHIQRIHRSYIANLKNATEITLKEIRIGEANIPVGRSHREQVKAFREQLEELSV